MRNTSLMQSISIYFTYVQSLHVSGKTLPIIRRSIKCTNQHMVWDRKTVVMIPEENRSLQFYGLTPYADLYILLISWWWAMFCPKHVETEHKWNIYLLTASGWCVSFKSLYDARKNSTKIYAGRVYQNALQRISYCHSRAPEQIWGDCDELSS